MKIDKELFESLMNMAKSMEITSVADDEYFMGYKKGLLKARYGRVLASDLLLDVDEKQHEYWCSVPEDEPDLFRRERGRGYRDGYNGKEPGKQDEGDAKMNVKSVRATVDSVGDWEGEEEAAAYNFNRIQDAIYEAAPAEYNDDDLHELMKAAWDYWGSEESLLTVTDSQIEEYVFRVI